MGKKIAFIGVGNMAGAMVGGIVGTGTFEREDILCINPRNEEKLMRVVNEFGVVRAEPCDVEKADVIVFAVKPQDFAAAASSYRPYINGGKLVISIMAGISFDTLKKHLGNVPMIRTMPNLALSVRESVTACALGEYATEEHAAIAEAIFSPLGIVNRVPEADITKVIGIAGSGIAYFCYMIEKLVETAVADGMSENTAAGFAVETLIGTAEILKMQDISPRELRNRISSRAGTTEAAIQAMDEHGFGEAINAAYAAACRRNDELTVENK